MAYVIFIRKNINNPQKNKQWVDRVALHSLTLQLK
jgi:hypothetical protein